MQRRFATADVFTTEALSGNPVAVVLDAEGLTGVFPLDGARSVYAYTRDGAAEDRCDLHVRMFTGRMFTGRMFTGRMVEDPATGSATASVTALLAELRGVEVRLRVREGEDMGRPSTLLTRSVAEGGAIRARVGGRCAAMFSGTFSLR